MSDLRENIENFDRGVVQKKHMMKYISYRTIHYCPISKVHPPLVPLVSCTSVGVSFTSVGVTECTSSLSALSLLASVLEERREELFSSSGEFVAEPEP